MEEKKEAYKILMVKIAVFLRRLFIRGKSEFLREVFCPPPHTHTHTHTPEKPLAAPTLSTLQTFASLHCSYDNRF
jgi:hypothetical protein